MSKIIFMMISVSFLVLFVIVMIFLWAVKNKQFDEGQKLIQLDDSQEALNDAYLLECRKKEALKRAQKK